MKSKLLLILVFAAFSFGVKAQWALDNFMPYLENGQYDEYLSKATESTDTLKGRVKRNVREAISLFEMITEKTNTQMPIAAFDSITKQLNVPIQYRQVENGLQLGVLKVGNAYIWFLHNTSDTHNRIVNLEGQFRTLEGIEYNTIRAGVSNSSVKMVAKTNFEYEYQLVYYKENKSR